MIHTLKISDQHLQVIIELLSQAQFRVAQPIIHAIGLQLQSAEMAERAADEAEKRAAATVDANRVAGLVEEKVAAGGIPSRDEMAKPEASNGKAPLI